MRRAFNNVHIRWTRGTSLYWFWLFIFIVIVFGPLLALIYELVQSLSADNGPSIRLAIPLGRRLVLLIRSLGLAGSVSIGGMVLGVIAGSILWRWHTGPGAYLRWFLLVPVLVPPYVHALAWSSTLDSVNSFLRYAGLPDIPFEGWVGSWWVLLMALAPIAVGLALVGLESVDPELIEASRLMRSDMETFKGIILPLAAPSILAGGGLLFLLSLMDYGVPSLFQNTVYSLEIFAEYSASNQPAGALLLAFPLLIATAMMVVIFQAGLKNAAQRPVWHDRPWKTGPAWPTWFVWLQRIAAALFVAQIAVPVLSLTGAVGTGKNMIATFSAARSEIVFSLWVAALAGMACLPLALAAARELLGSKKRNRLWWLLIVAPLAIPSPLIGIGLIAIWNRPFLPDVYGSSLMPLFAVLARFTPIAAFVLLAQLRRIDPLLIDAARVVRTSRFRRWLQIEFPMLAPGLLAAGFIVFALSMGELGATLIVAPPGQATLTMRIYNYLHYGASGEVAGLGLMMTVIALAAGGAAMAALAGWSHLLPRAGTRPL